MRRTEVTEKTCACCKATKPVADFYRDKRTSDRLNCYCKTCSKSKSSKWRYDNQEKANEFYRRWYKKHLPELRAKSLAYKRRNPEKTQARTDLNNAIARGRMKRLPCEVCGNPKSQGHHEDYSKPLEVRWMCMRCHAKEHRYTPEGIAAREQGR